MSGALGRRGKRLTDHHHRLSVVKSAAVCSSFVQDIRVDKPADVAAAWDVALGADRSTLLEMVTDPNVPPAPPHVSAKQVRNYLAALLHGDPQSLEIVKTGAREWWNGLKAGKG